MADETQLERLRSGVDAWNASIELRSPRVVYTDGGSLPGLPAERIDLTRADLAGRDLQGAMLVGADLTGADLSGSNLAGALLRTASLHGTRLHDACLVDADLYGANLTLADVSDANLSAANLYGADMGNCKAGRARFASATLTKADLSGAYLFGADFSRADLSGVNLSQADLVHASLANARLIAANLDGADLHHADLLGADLTRASLVRTIFYDARLDGARVYGISIWDAYISNVTQRGLVVTPREDETAITVDNIETAQFVSLMLSRTGFGRALDALTAKAVLILGRFTQSNRPVLDALRDALRSEDLAPIVFDFERPATRDLTETIGLLAHMARFVVADLSDAKSLPQELQLVVPNLPSVPVVPVLREQESEYAMFEHFRRYPWVAEVRRYASSDDLVRHVREWIIEPAEHLLEVMRGPA